MVARKVAAILMIIFASGVFVSATHGPLEQTTSSVETQVTTQFLTSTQTLIMSTATTTTITTSGATTIAISPNHGCPLGTSTPVTVVGDGFGNSTSVSISFMGSVVGTAKSTRGGSFSATVSVADGAAGQVSILATDALGHSASTTYTIYSSSPC